MRKLLFSFVLCLPLFTSAQMRVGVRGGMNFASIKEYSVANRISPRINIGTMIEIPFDEYWLLYTGPYYSGKGIIFGRSSETNKIDSFTIRLNYIELPVSIGYKFSAERENRVSVAGGIYIGYGFNGSISVRDSRQPPLDHLHRKETDQYKRIEAGYNFMTMFEIKSRYGIRLDLSKSLFSIDTEKEYKKKNLVMGFSFFWYLKKKKEADE